MTKKLSIKPGDTYGFLTVLDIVPARSGAHHSEVIVKCVCGNESYTRQYPLLTGAHKSCGCKGVPGFSAGDQVHDWTIVETADVPKRGRHYECMCKCGTLCIVSLSDLSRGASKRCSKCGFIESSMKRFIPYGYVFKTYRNNAKKRDKEFTLTLDEAVELFTSDCHYCKAGPSNSYSGGGSTWMYNGIDRKNNNLGYTPDNVVPCCRICNIGKAGLSYEQYMDWIMGVAERVKHG